MGLERIHLYHLVRVLRVLVPVLLAAFASVLLWAWATRPPEAQPDGAEARLGENMSSLTEDRVLSRGRDDCTLFRIEASEDFGLLNGIHQLEDVEVVLGGCGGAPERRIRGLRCGVRQMSDEALDIACEGGVEVELDPGTTVRTEQLTYEFPAEKISSPAPVEIVREGAFRMRADQMTAFPREGLYDLAGRVEVVQQDGSRLTSGVLRYEENRGLLTAGEPLEVRMGSLHMTGRTGRAWLEPVTLELVRVEFRENVRASSLDAAVPGALTARELDVEPLGEEGTRVRARGDVVVESGADPDRRVLSGQDVQGMLDRAGSLQSFEAAGNASLRLGTGELIRSAVIRQLPDQSLETGEDSVLESADSRVTGREFRIRRGERVRFETDRFASIRTPDGLFEGGATRASFDPAAGALVTLEQSGAVRFELQGVSGGARRIAIDEQWIELTGEARLVDDASELESETIRLGRASRDLVAEGSVLLIAWSEDGPIFVESDRLERRGDQEPMSFTGAALLRRDQSQVSAGRIDVDPESRAFFAEGAVDSTMPGMRVWSDELRFDEEAGRIEYSGSVRAESDELNVTSEDLDLVVVNGEVARMEASGAVRVNSGTGVRASGERAVYLRDSETLTMSGPGSEVVDPENGRCMGEEIVIALDTRDLEVRGGEAGRSVCSRP